MESARSDYFPSLPAKTLDGRKMNFPADLRGQKSFLVLAFEDRGAYENCQQQADRWAAWWEQSLAPRQVGFYELPMMSRTYALARFWIDTGMRSGIPPQKHGKVACFYGDKEQYMRQLGIRDLSQAHVFLLDEEGRILSRASGLPDAGNIRAIEAGLSGN